MELCAAGPDPLRAGLIGAAKVLLSSSAQALANVRLAGSRSMGTDNHARARMGPGGGVETRLGANGGRGLAGGLDVPSPRHAATASGLRTPLAGNGGHVLRRRLGAREVSAIGLGAMPMSLEGRPSRARATTTIHASLDCGITLIDTADAYSTGGDDAGHNERLVAEALRSWSGPRDEVVVATKGGHIRPGDGSWQVDGRPEYLKAACEASLFNLGVEAIDLYQFHRPDPRVPFADSVGALADLLREGKIRMAGLSNVTVEQIDEALEIAPIVSVQNQFSPAFRSSAGELAHCEHLGIAFLAWSPLGGMSRASAMGERHGASAEVARRHGVSPQQVVLAWELAQGDCVIPIPGSSRPETIRDSAAAVDLQLSAEDLEVLEAA